MQHPFLPKTPSHPRHGLPCPPVAHGIICEQSLNCHHHLRRAMGKKQRKKNPGSRVALLLTKFLLSRKFFKEMREQKYFLLKP